MEAESGRGRASADEGSSGIGAAALDEGMGEETDEVGGEGMFSPEGRFGR